MINISKTDEGITLRGHANYAPHGQDVVCAGVSTLVQTLIQSIEELTQDKIQYSMSPGRVDINYRDLSERAQLLVNSFFVGAFMIASEYPDNVHIAICDSKVTKP